LKAWAGKEQNLTQARRILLHRERCNGLAALGRYTEAVERELAA
jgi:fructose-bisphosphate aldolase class I